eukprot:TRINITY_DN16747_c0_g1_i1.p1 TRINITY_DN16747_c0_g1~~TRINITY_DN16747_c0_g1_i1.p1  ORF type:complete len:207 (-),score=40.04 TRINITY_DN16747_c0_g1_i1:47-667(-)
MFSSMIKVSEEARHQYLNVSSPHTSYDSSQKYAVMSVPHPYRAVELVHAGTESDTYASFLKHFAGETAHCAICCYRLSFFSAERKVEKKVVWILWCPDDAPMREKMVYASAYNSIQQMLPHEEKGILVQANRAEDVAIKAVIYFLKNALDLEAGWSPDTHILFPERFRDQVLSVYLCLSIHDSPLPDLPYELLARIFVEMEPEIAY